MSNSIIEAREDYMRSQGFQPIFSADPREWAKVINGKMRFLNEQVAMDRKLRHEGREFLPEPELNVNVYSFSFLGPPIPITPQIQKNLDAFDKMRYPEVPSTVPGYRTFEVLFDTRCQYCRQQIDGHALWVLGHKYCDEICMRRDHKENRKAAPHP
jgi:hypothetical protein